MTGQQASNPESSERVDVLSLDARDYKREVRVNLDSELIESIDARRVGASRSEYVEQVLFAAMARIMPHLPDDWTPETHAAEIYARMGRHAQRPATARVS